MSEQRTSGEEDQWIADQRRDVVHYLAAEGVEHGGVGEDPAFHVHPYLALWAVQSRRSAGAIGWWALSGDVPKDYISSNDGRHPREALRAFARHWRDWSSHMQRAARLTPIIR